ncbi:peptidase M61 [Roseivirga sp.]|uniref:M61 family metallopeptidase n=1 Tax=Roseivirga sp. TaxID=1964215 RepID=UPI003B8CF22C
MNRKSLMVLFLGLMITASVWAAKPYKYTVYLTKVENDKVFVELTPPKIKKNEIVFYLPKIIPGTYAIADYGRMVSAFKAYDKKGNVLSVERVDDNTWKISNAKKLRKITYQVEDTYDTVLEGPDIFQPAGTNIEEGKNYIINPSGFFGYFEGMKKEEFEINFVRDRSFYGATGLKAEKIGLQKNLKLNPEIATATESAVLDRFSVKDYDQLVDSPLMYSKLDTAIVKVANTEVLVASYSPNNKVTSKEIAASIKEVLAAQTDFLGGKLPVDKYAFIFYFTDQPVTSYGALEHSYSSFYYMPEQTIEQMSQQLRDFAAHEFFHIVTPLNIHSEEIGSFDFNDPKMSRHLWMYEGMTEYFAGSVQVKYGLVSPEEYLGMLGEKILTATRFKDELPFTELSLGALNEYADQYYNVYQKGALIGAALDIKLRKLSNGSYGVQNMMADLSKKYGKDKSFQDDQLFEEIVAMTYPEIDEFFKTYVAGNTPLPYDEIFGQVGVELTKDATTLQHTIVISGENVAVTMHENKRYLAVGDVTKMDALGQALKFQNGDILVKMNGDEINFGPEINSFLNNQFGKISTGLETMTFTVLRDIDGEKKEVKLSAPNVKVEVPLPLSLRFVDNPNAEQLSLRKLWIEK